MKVSLNWIKDFTPVNLSNDELISRLGSQLGAVEGVEYIGDKYKGILIVKVVECYKHDQADKLNVVKIDDGGKIQGIDRDENGLIQVVCGAPNVRADMLAVWIPPKATVPSTFDKDPFVLESRELRGKISNGMLASPKELDFSDNHEGLLEIDMHYQPGTSFSEAYKLDDCIVELENKMFTHRPDCFGMIGIAREISGIQDQVFISPEWYSEIPEIPQAESNDCNIIVENQIEDSVPRFVAVAISDIEVKPSPIMVQSYLMRVGIRPINNIVDATNYMMILTGQPMHAYDYDKVRSLSQNQESATLVVRKATKNESLKLLNDKDIKLNDSDIVIATDNQVIGLAGIMGGASTEVDSGTKNIILECATFDMYTIRRSSMEHGIFSDAVTRFTKGQSSRQNMAITARAIKLIRDISDGHQSSQVIDNSNINQHSNIISFSPDFVNSRLGTSLSKEDMARILTNVEFVVDASSDELKVAQPFWRTDIEIKEDLVEEIGRLDGYFKLKRDLPSRKINPAAKNPELEINSLLRNDLSSAGANEVISSTFIHGDLVNKAQQEANLSHQIANALSPDLQYYRLSLTPSLLDLVYSNIRSNQGVTEDNEFAIFELGKSHNILDKDREELPTEYRTMALLFSADDKTAKRKYDGAAYYQAKKYLSYIVNKNSLKVEVVPLNTVSERIKANIRLSQLVAPYEMDRSAAILSLNNNEVLGVVGEFKRSVIKAFKLPIFSAGFEIDLNLFNENLVGSKYIPLPKFPKINQDICLRVESSMNYSTLFETVWDEIGQNKPEATFFNLSLVDIFGKEDDPNHKQITLRLIISAYDRTLTSDLVSELLDRVANKAHESLGAERV